jgi:Holliday junction DNA helicase RuvB
LLQEDSPCAPETIPVGNIPQSAGGELPTPLRTFFERDSLASHLWFTWDSIKSVTLKALNQTFYDLVVPLAHHYLAEGIWNHNTGKTMLAEIIAHEVGRPLRVGMGQSLQNPARVADFLLSLRAGDVLFVDEIHGLKPACQETFYRAMEGRVLMPIDKPGEPVRAPLPLPPFTLIGATTDEWRLMEPLLQRFEYRIRLDRMSVEELSRAISQRAKARGLSLTDDAAVMIAQRAHGTPRLAVMLLARCMDVALAGKATTVTGLIVERACEISRLDALGLDSVERHYLSVLLHANGKPVRLNVIASQLDQLSRRTVEGRVEPTLIWMGLIEKRPDGRILTAEGRRYLTTGIVPGK